MATRKPVLQAPPLPTRAQWAEWVNAQRTANPNFVPPEQLMQEDLKDWQSARSKLTLAQAQEMALRLKIAKHLFPAPEEGTNKVALPDGTVVECKHVISRKLDPAALEAVKKFRVGDMRTYLEQLKIDASKFPDDALVADVLKISVDKLVKYEPDLVLKEYRSLTAEQLAIFDTALTIKPGAPQMSVSAKEADGEQG